MAQEIDFIMHAGACIASKKAFDGSGRIKWMVRSEPLGEEDTGWTIFTDADTEESMNDANNLQVVSFNSLCNIEPSLVSIYNFPVGSDLQLVNDGRYRIYDSKLGVEVPRRYYYRPPEPDPNEPNPYGHVRIGPACRVSKLLLDEQVRGGRARRESPLGPVDSGWEVFGEGEDESIFVGIEHSEVVTLASLLMIMPVLRRIITAPVGTDIEIRYEDNGRQNVWNRHAGRYFAPEDLIELRHD